MKERMKAKVESSLEICAKLEPFRAELKCSMAQLAMAWCMANPNVSTSICGASSLAQLKDTLGSIEVVPKLTPDVMKQIDEATGTVPPWDEIYNQTTSSRKQRTPNCPAR